MLVNLLDKSSKGMIAVAFLLILVGETNAFFKFYKEGQNGSLACIPTTGEVAFWFLHGKGRAIDYNSRDDIFVNEEGSLSFQNVSKAKHEGQHVCVVKIENTFEAHYVEMRVEPLPKSNLWDYQYRRMFVTAFISALICLVLFVGFCLVKQYRWRGESTKEGNAKPEGYVNEAIEDTEEYNSKM